MPTGLCSTCYAAPASAARTESVGLVVAVSSHESATFRGGGGHFCGRVVRLATRQGLLDLSRCDRTSQESKQKDVETQVEPVDQEVHLRAPLQSTVVFV